MKISSALVIAALLGLFYPSAMAQNKTEWQYSREENPLYGKSFDRFVLTGRYYKAPSTIVGNEQPRMIIGCVNGKFSTGEFSLGAVAQFSGTRSLKGVGQSQITIRTDEKKPTDDWFEVSNDQKTLFFDRVQFNRFLTGRLLGHPSAQSALVHRLTLGVVEAFGNQVIIQFDMPEDVSQIVTACGLEWGKKRR
jgi:hypothetical protein